MVPGGLRQRADAVGRPLTVRCTAATAPLPGRRVALQRSHSRANDPTRFRAVARRRTTGTGRDMTVIDGYRRHVCG